MYEAFSVIHVVSKPLGKGGMQKYVCVHVNLVPTRFYSHHSLDMRLHAANAAMHATLYHLMTSTKDKTSLYFVQ